MVLKCIVLKKIIEINLIIIIIIIIINQIQSYNPLIVCWYLFREFFPPFLAFDVYMDNVRIFKTKKRAKVDNKEVVWFTAKTALGMRASVQS